ncbi:hypothetical protein [Oscillatoria acuminata]|uniref:Uncharacterized protein n=1 Tax=Oscillatoria acuminata PCC 6304 TaxID=56110 RepID=K9TJ18_9CYAN|nr:hypothetical protein [Oscillatoria acuminata]AFY82019.1 hypothetical protein Oscil6304_2394 [Oscillatoria acuminata PCC 6304]
MRLQLKSAVGVLALLGASVVVAPEAVAQSQPRNIAEQFEEAFFRSSDTFYQNRSIFDQISFYLLPMTYPERQAERDAERINKLYHAVMEVQNSSDPVLRTPDLPNPFDESLLTLPSYTPSGVPFNPLNEILPLR